MRKGKVKVDLPALVESGNAVPIAISVESAMTSTDYVKAIYVFNERNPQPSVVGVQLGPRAGRASFSTRIRSIRAGPRTEAQWDGYAAVLDYKFTAADEALIDRLVPPGHPSDGDRVDTIMTYRS